MMRLIPAFRTIALASLLVFAGAAAATAEETTTTVAVETETEEPFSPTIYVGPAFGYADAEGGDFAWAVHAAARMFEYGAIQLEYFNVGNLRAPQSGNFDGLYVGLMPIIPVADGFGIFGQVGAAFSDAGDDVAGGGGLLYVLPIDFLQRNNVDATMRLDYKYFNLGDGAHSITLGLMLGFHK